MAEERAPKQRLPVAPHFVVCIVNDTTIIRCTLSPGAKTIQSDIVELMRRSDTVASGPSDAVPVGANTTLAAATPVGHVSAPGIAHPNQRQGFSLTSRLPQTLPDVPHIQRSGASTLPPGFLRCMLYSPNLVADDYPQFSWDADLDVDGTTFFIGTIRKRCEVIDKRFVLPAVPRRVQLRLHRLRLAPVRSPESEQLAAKLCHLFQDPSFNPRSGSLALQVISEEATRRFPQLYRKVIGGEHLGSFRAFIVAHSDSFSIFHYRVKEITNRRLTNVTAHDERVAIRKEVRDSSPPMLPQGHENEKNIIALLEKELRDCDSSVHHLLRRLSSHDSFRVGMSAAFSTLMHWLQRHRDIFRWSTDPQSLCTIGLNYRPQLSPSLESATKNSGEAAASIGRTHPQAESAQETARRSVDAVLSLEEQDALAMLGIDDDSMPADA